MKFGGRRSGMKAARMAMALSVTGETDVGWCAATPPNETTDDGNQNNGTGYTSHGRPGRGDASLAGVRAMAKGEG